MKKNSLNLVLLPLMLISMSGCAQPDPTTVIDFKFADEVGFPSEMKITESGYINFNVTHYDESVSSLAYTCYNQKQNLDAGITLSLFKEGEDTNVIDEALVSGQKYTLKASYQGFEDSKEFVADERVALLKKEKLAFTAKDVDSDYSASNGNVKLLVIPVNLTGDWLDVWDESYRSEINSAYFGSSSLSLTSYYRDCSNGAMNVSGLVSEIIDYTAYTSNQIQNNYGYLYSCINYCLAKVEASHPEIDWKEYDLDYNGHIDNFHIVTNFNPSLYESDTHSSAWATNLWPHMSMLANDPNDEVPTAKTYSAGVLNHLIDSYGNTSAITPIHEQGHIFGLSDYYDYGGLVDYIGSFDMQSGNVLDWNSYSKLSVGWIDSYVIKDECTITIPSAAIGGKCLIIPANPKKFNNSAFDEYFLVELFSKQGNNAKFGHIWSSIFSGKEEKYGARLYHVDSRLFNSSGKATDNPDEGFLVIDNNSYDYSYSRIGVTKLADMKQLTLIQKGGADTFGDEENSRKYLKAEDLFNKGDTFTFEKYAKFLSKRHKKVQYMDDGETFPYQIDFVEMNENMATIKISKIVTD